MLVSFNYFSSNRGSLDNWRSSLNDLLGVDYLRRGLNYAFYNLDRLRWASNNHITRLGIDKLGSCYILGRNSCNNLRHLFYLLVNSTRSGRDQRTSCEDLLRVNMLSTNNLLSSYILLTTYYLLSSNYLLATNYLLTLYNILTCENLLALLLTSIGDIDYLLVLGSADHGWISCKTGRTSCLLTGWGNLLTISSVRSDTMTIVNYLTSLDVLVGLRLVVDLLLRHF